MYIELKTAKKFFYTFILTVSICLAIGLFLLYGPIDKARVFLVTSAMTTLKHHWVATTFYDDDVITKIMAVNKVKEISGDTKSNEIKIDDKKHVVDAIFKRKDDEPITVITIKRNGYVGFLTVVYDPNQIDFGVTRYLLRRGELARDIANETGALAVINASGFLDDGGQGNGGTPTGIVIQNGNVLFDVYSPLTKHSIIGFDKNRILRLGKYTNDEALSAGIIDGVEFGPFLIVNGKSSVIEGNGGWGIAPRTAIGQRKDGIVMFLTIDGRQPGYSNGAVMNDVLEIMEEYGAYNAANLDGGSSAILVIDGKTVNKPSSHGGERALPTWFMVMPK